MFIDCHTLEFCMVRFQPCKPHLLMYKNLQFLIISIGGCVLPTKWTIIKSYNDINDNGNSFSTSIAHSRSCANIIRLPLSACWPIIPPLFVYINLNYIVWQGYLAIKVSSTITISPACAPLSNLVVLFVLNQSIDH